MKAVRLFAVNLVVMLLLCLALHFFRYYVIGWTDKLNLDYIWVYYRVFSHSGDPYSVYGFFNPPWVAWTMRPLGWIPLSYSFSLWITLSIMIIAKSVYSMGGNWLSVFLTIISPGFMVCLINGQLDPLVILGLAMGSWALILVKPHVAGFTVLYDMVKGRVDWFSVLVFAASFVVSGFWIIRVINNQGLETRIGQTPFPYMIPVGIILFVISLVKRDKYLAALSTYFFVPYFSASSFVVYSAIATSRYGKIVAILFSALMWGYGIRWFT